MVILIPHGKGRWASGHDLCPSFPEKWGSVAMAMPIPLPKGRKRVSHGLCLSPLEERSKRAMVTCILHGEGKVYLQQCGTCSIAASAPLLSCQLCTQKWRCLSMSVNVSKQ